MLLALLASITQVPGSGSMTSIDNLFELNWEPVGRLGLGITLTARGVGTAPSWAGFALSANGQMLGDGANLAIIGSTLDGVDAYLMSGKNRAQIQIVPGLSASACGVDLIGSTVLVDGTDLVLSFTLSFAATSGQPCTLPEGTATSLALVQGGPAVGVIAAHGPPGTAASLAQHPLTGTMVAQALDQGGVGAVSGGGVGGGGAGFEDATPTMIGFLVSAGVIVLLSFVLAYCNTARGFAMFTLLLALLTLASAGASHAGTPPVGFVAVARNALFFAVAASPLEFLGTGVVICACGKCANPDGSPGGHKACALLMCLAMVLHVGSLAFVATSSLPLGVFAKH